MVARHTMLLALICLLSLGCAARAADAEPTFAREITGQAEITVSRGKATRANLTDRDYRTEWQGQDGAYVDIRLPDDLPCFGLSILVSGDPYSLSVQAETPFGWQAVDIPGERFNTQYIPLPGVTHLSIVPSNGKSFRLMELRLFSEGEPPKDVVRFTATADKSDLMVLACHPDDDILWMGGLMPTYAGQLGMNVQLVYMTARFSYRRCEAMDALWHCGVTTGPVFVGLPDITDPSYTDAVAQWGGLTEIGRKIARVIRQCRPEVLVTQDVKGEYGHTQHRAMVAACNLAVRFAADPNERSLRDLPAWEVRKYYIHLYKEQPLTLDFEQPLSAFGGRSAFEIAQEAFALHKSQQSGRYAVAVDGPYDIRRYGLAYSTVGEDENHDGLFEHIDGLYELEQTLIRQP